MFGHLPELILILAIGLIVFGPEKLPEVAANVGKMVREFRDIVDTAMNPVETHVPEDFSQYYYESLTRAGEEPAAEEELHSTDYYEVIGGEETEDEALVTEPEAEFGEIPALHGEAEGEPAAETAPPHDG